MRAYFDVRMLVRPVVIVIARLALSSLAAFFARPPLVSLDIRRALLAFALLFRLVELLLRLEQRSEGNRGEFCMRQRVSLRAATRRVALHTFAERLL